MRENFDRDTCLELTTGIVLEAIRNGKLDASNGQTVADFFLTVCHTITDCAALEPSDLEKLFRRLTISRKEANSDS